MTKPKIHGHARTLQTMYMKASPRTKGPLRRANSVGLLAPKGALFVLGRPGDKKASCGTDISIDGSTVSEHSYLPVRYDNQRFCN